MNDAIAIEGLNTLHIIGLCGGLGGAMLADLLALRALLSSRDGSFSAVFRQINGLVLAGLALVWVSGLALALVEFTSDPMPAKVTIKAAFAALLMLNALFIRYRVVPLFDDPRRPLAAHLKASQVLEVVLFGSISFTCWFSALFVAKFSILQTMQVARLCELALMLWGGSACVLLAMILAGKAWGHALGAMRDRAEVRGGRRAPQAAPGRSVACEQLARPAPVEPQQAPAAVQVRTNGGSEGELPILDEAVLLRLAQAPGDAQPTQLPQAISYFLAQAPRVLLALAEAAQEERQADCAKAAQTLKAMSGAIKAPRLEAASAQFGDRAARGDTEHLSERLSGLKQELSRVLQAIVEHCPSSAERDVTPVGA